MSAPGAKVRSDNASAFQSLLNDDQLKLRNISIELGRVKNVNKNPIGEKCVQELEEELCRIKPIGVG